MATSGAYSGHEDLDDDIERLNIVLLQEGNDEDKESDEELQNLDRTGEELPSHASHASATSYASRPSTNSDVTASSFPTTSMGTEVDDLVLRFDPHAFNAESCLAMNRAYQEVLLDSLRQIDVALNENRAKQRELSEELDEKCTTKGIKSLPKSLMDYSTPYFRDALGGAPPQNEDVRLKAFLDETKQYVKPKPGWTKSHRKNLLSAVQLDALEQQIRPLMNKLEVETNRAYNCKSHEEIEESKKKVKALKDQVKEKQMLSTNELLQLVDTSKIDFMKISAITFNGKYDTQECESMWKNVLQPGINKEKWSQEEEQHLVELAEKHGMREWQQIAEELGTNRTPFQCLQHFQQNHFLYDTSEWSAEEDALLHEVIDTCQYGVGKIQWHQVAYYMERRSASQCRTRWIKISPSLKHGRWTAQEDYLLSTAVRTVGVVDWLRVQEFVPRRTAIQCRERWLNCLDPNLSFEPWTYEEDKKLMKLFEQFDKNWVAIAERLPGRTDNRCLCRYKTLMSWKRSMERFNDEPHGVKESLISSFFTLTEDGEILPDLKKFEKHSKKTQKNKVKTIAADDCDDNEDGDYRPKLKEVEPEDFWEKVAKRGDLQATDYLKQIQDRKTGDIVVPRPPPMKRYTIRSTNSMWKRRQEIKQIMQMCVNTTTPEEINQPEQALDSVSNSLDAILNVDLSDPAVREMIDKALNGRRPHELTVRQLLDISRAIKTNRSIENLKLGLDDKGSGNDTDEEEEDAEEVELIRYESDVSDHVEEESSSSEEDFEEYQENLQPAKPKRVVSEAHQNARRVKREAHMEVVHRLHALVKSKLVNEKPRLPGRRGKTYQMYPESSSINTDPRSMANKSLAILLKSFDVDTSEVYEKANRLKRKQSAVAFLNLANKFRRSQRQEKKRLQAIPSKTEELETVDLILGLKDELGIKDSDSEVEESDAEQDTKDDNDESVGNTNESNESGTVESSANVTDGGRTVNRSSISNGNGTSVDNPANGNETNGNNSVALDNKDEKFKHVAENDTGKDNGNEKGDCKSAAGMDTGKDTAPESSAASATASTSGEGQNAESDPNSYKKTLPFIPPNLSNLKALKSMLLEHRCLIDRAGGFFNREDFKEHLYSLKKTSGPNPLLPVFMAVSRAVGGRQSEFFKHNYQRTTPKGEVLMHIRKSKAYQMLKARFQSMFVWPALLSTVNCPQKSNTEQKTADLEAKDEAADVEITVDKMKVAVKDEAVDEVIDEEVVAEDEEEETETVEDEDSKIITENVAQAVQEMIDADEEILTHEQAIEKLVEKILAEYKATRESKKRRPVRKSRKRAEEQFKKMVHQRERTKILKRLGLWETMEKYRREREASAGGASSSTSAGRPDGCVIVNIKKEVTTDCSEDMRNEVDVLNGPQTEDEEENVVEIVLDNSLGALNKEKSVRIYQNNEQSSGIPQDKGNSAGIPQDNRKSSGIPQDTGTTTGTLQNNTNDQSTVTLQDKGQGTTVSQDKGIKVLQGKRGKDVLQDKAKTNTILQDRKDMEGVARIPKDKQRNVETMATNSKVVESGCQTTYDLPAIGQKRKQQADNAPVNKKRGRPFGAKNFLTIDMDNVRQSSRQKERPPPVQLNALLGKRRRTNRQSTKKVKLSRLKELIPEKMSSLATQIPDLPLLQEAKEEAEKAKLAQEGENGVSKLKGKKRRGNSDKSQYTQGGKVPKTEKNRKAKRDNNQKKGKHSGPKLKAMMDKKADKVAGVVSVLKGTGSGSVYSNTTSMRTKSSVMMTSAGQTDVVSSNDTSPNNGTSTVARNLTLGNLATMLSISCQSDTSDLLSNTASPEKEFVAKPYTAVPIKVYKNVSIATTVNVTAGQNVTIETSKNVGIPISKDIARVTSDHVAIATTKAVTIATGSSVAGATGNSVGLDLSFKTTMTSVPTNSGQTSKSSTSGVAAGNSSPHDLHPVSMATAKSHQKQVIIAVPLKVGNAEQVAYLPVSINVPERSNSGETAKPDN